MTSLRFREFKYWSPITGAEAARISMVDDHNQEFFMIIPDERGFKYRERRAEAVEMIIQAIERGLDPGEVSAA